MKVHGKKSRGSVLMLSIFLLIALFTTAAAFLNLLPVESRAALRSERIAVAGLIADAGVTEALAWLRFQLAPPSGVSSEPLASSVYLSESARTRDMGNDWKFRWWLEADDQTYPNGSNPIRGYTIVCRAYHKNVAQREARCQVIQESLSQYAALYNQWPSNLVQPVRSDSAPSGGPVHVNDVMRLWIPEGAAFWSSAGLPPYSDGLTATGTFAGSQDGFAYYQGNWSGSDATKLPYNSGGPIDARYNRMVSGGRENMESGHNTVPLPTNTFAIRDAAWGFNPVNPYPTSNGVYLNVENGSANGIYIRGNVEEMELGFGGTQPAGSGTANYGNNSWVKIEQPTSGRRRIDNHECWTVVTVTETMTLPSGTVVNGTALTGTGTYGPGTTLMRNPNGTFQHVASELNGVVYTDGNVNDLWGVNRGRRTIAVSSGSGVSHNIIIGGKESDASSTSAGAFSTAAGQKGLIQDGAVDADGNGVLDAPADADAVLGVIADNVLISSKLKPSGSWATDHPADNPLYLYATVLAGINDSGGSYRVDGYDSGGGGYAYRYGSRIMKSSGAWGTTSGHGLVNGNTFFDQPASISPPPYFPSTPTFAVKSYEEIVVTDGETI